MSQAHAIKGITPGEIQMFLEGLPVGILKMPIRGTTSKLRVRNLDQIIAVG